MSVILAMEYKEDALHMIDQRKLPHTFEMFIANTCQDVDFAIRDMVVRGAPAIGAAAGYGAALAARAYQHEDKNVFLLKMEESLKLLNKSRPTAVNLMWAIKRMQKCIGVHQDLPVNQLADRILEEAHAIVREDQAINLAMGNYGNSIVPKGAIILTHCNTGALATVGIGTALGVIRTAHKSGKEIFVYADETRPRLQGGRLTAWELMQEGIPSTLIADSAAATLIRDGKIDVILVGADRIATNGDTANKIGTFMLSVVAKAFGVPFYVVAPTTTIDFDIDHGALIVIEERNSEEVTHIEGVHIAPEGMSVYNPAFDVTPYENITGIVTEKGIIRPPYQKNIMKLKEQ